MTKAVRSRAAHSLSSCSYLNKKELSFYELYLELLKSPSSMFCSTIHLVPSNPKQDSSILNLAMISPVHSVNPHLEIKHLTKWQSVQFVLQVQTCDCLIALKKKTLTRSWCKPSLGNKTPRLRAWCKTSLGIKHHDLFYHSIHESVKQFLPHNTW